MILRSRRLKLIPEMSQKTIYKIAGQKIVKSMTKKKLRTKARSGQLKNIKYVKIFNISKI